MEKNYEATISQLKEMGLLLEKDNYVFCKYAQPVTLGATLFGALSGVMTVEWSHVDYLMAANEDEIKIFYITKKTGDFTNEYIVLTKKDIDKIACKKYLFGNRTIVLRSKQIKPNIDFWTCNVFKKFDQAEQKAVFVEFLKANFVGQVSKNAV